MAIMRAKTVSVTSIRGGTGKTTTVLNLAATISLNKLKVLVIDLDLYESAVGPLLNITNEENIYTLASDMLNGYTKPLNTYVTPYNAYIDCILAPNDPRRAASVYSKSITDILEKFKSNYDYIIIDTNYFMNDLNLSILDASDLILYVIDNDLVSLKAMRSMSTIYKDIEKTNYKILVNKSLNKYKEKFDNYDINNIIGTKIDYIIPSSFYQKNMAEYINKGNILLLDKGIRKSNPKVCETFKNIIDDIDKEVHKIEKIN